VPHWGRSLADAADLFDSMYVSLYKGLGATSGALVVCSEDLAGELRTWRSRMGGTLFSMTAAAVGGLMGLREHLSRFDHYRSWAIELAAALGEHGITTFPEVPHIATFLAYAPGTAEEVNERVVAFTEARGIVPCGLWRDTDVPGWVETELTCYEAAASREPAEVARLLSEAVLAANLLP
jgi:threonine aldolase